VRELKGKTAGVGAPGGSMQGFVEFLLEKEGLPRNSVSFAGIGVGPTAVAAIEGRKVDAGVVLASALVRLRERDPKLHVIAETFTPEGSTRVFGQSRYPAMALIAKRDFLRAQPDVAKRLVRSLQRAIAWMRENGAEGVHRELPATNLDALRMHLPRYAAWAEIQTGDVQTVAKYLKIDTAPERTFVNDFVRSARTQ
jgi:NitT/TauT family transport system substrate-binding protein